MRATVIATSLAFASHILADPDIYIDKVLSKTFIPEGAIFQRGGRTYVRSAVPVAPADAETVATEPGAEIAGVTNVGMPSFALPLSNHHGAIAYLRRELLKLKETRHRLTAEFESVLPQMATIDESPRAQANPKFVVDPTILIWGFRCFGYGIGVTLLLSTIYQFFVKETCRAPAINMNPCGAELQSSAATSIPLIPASVGLRTVGVAMSDVGGSGGSAVPSRCSRRAADVHQQLNNERRITRETWEKADAYRPGKPAWFTKQAKDLVALHKALQAERILEIEEPRSVSSSEEERSLLGALLKNVATGDLALTLCSQEAPVLKELRDWLMSALTIDEAVCGLPEEQGRVLTTVAKALDARKLIDLGTFTGYSSIAMALATADDSRVICCEPDKKYARHARNWWVKAGCTNKMEMHECGAENLMQNMLDDGEEGTVDMIFCDISERERYPACHELAMQLLHVGGVIIYYDTLWPADTVLQHSYYPQVRAFTQFLASDPRVTTSVLPLSYGITICVKTLNADGPIPEMARNVGKAGDDDLLRKLLMERRDAAQTELDALSSSSEPSL